MDEVVGTGFTNVESITSTKDLQEVINSENGAPSVRQEYENRNKFLEIRADGVRSTDKMVSESLTPSNDDWNHLCSTNGICVVHETSPRPIISVRKTEDLFRIAGDVEDGAGVKGELTIQQPAVAVIQEPAQKINNVADNFVNRSALSQFDATLRAIGSEVVAYPLNSTARSIESNQMRTDLREKTPKIKLADSITIIKKTTQPMKKDITEMLANRGVTVSSVGPQKRKLGPAVSITSQSQKAKCSPNRLPTVDLTKESDNPRRLANRLNRRSRGKYLCQICDKLFAWPFELAQHMSCHRGSRLECKECTAQYLTEADLAAHRQQYHGPPPDMAIPVVDLQQGGVLNKLSRLGIRSVIPLAQLHSGSSGSGTFALPVVAIGAASNPAICDIALLGASNLLPIGPLKAISFNHNR